AVPTGSTNTNRTSVRIFRCWLTVDWARPTAATSSPTGIGRPCRARYSTICTRDGSARARNQEAYTSAVARSSNSAIIHQLHRLSPIYDRIVAGCGDEAGLVQRGERCATVVTCSVRWEVSPCVG